MLLNDPLPPYPFLCDSSVQPSVYYPRLPVAMAVLVQIITFLYISIYLTLPVSLLYMIFL